MTDFEYECMLDDREEDRQQAINERRALDAACMHPHDHDNNSHWDEDECEDGEGDES